MERDPINASEIELRAPKYIYGDQILKGAINVVAGKPNQGKGLFVAHLAATLSQRGEHVIYCAMEDDPREMTGPRLVAAGADMGKITFWRFQLPQQMEQVVKLARERNTQLVILDPVAAILGRGVSRFSDSIRKVTNPMQEVSEQTGVTWVAVDHTLKKAPKDAAPLAAISGGGSGIAAASRAAFLFGKDPADGDVRYLAAVKGNTRPDGEDALVYELDVAEVNLDDGKVDGFPYLLAQGTTQIDPALLLEKPDNDTPGRPPSKRAAASEWLSNYLYDAGKGEGQEPVRAGLVLEDAKLDGRHTEKTVRRSADDMGVIRTPPGGGRKCTWELPDPIIEAIRDGRAAAAAEAQEADGADTAEAEADAVVESTDLDAELRDLLDGGDSK